MQNAAILKADEGMEAALVGWLKSALEQDLIDAVLLPVKVPAGDSFAYLLLQDPSVLDQASPLPPVMPIQGGKVINRLTSRGTGNQRIAAVMRPCEARAAVELEKLKQAHLESITLITMDCNGVLPLADYLDDPTAAAARFEEASATGDRGPMRPNCQNCDRFSLPQSPISDLHIGTTGTEAGEILLIPNSPEGERLLDGTGMAADAPLDNWKARVEELWEAQTQRRHDSQEELAASIAGPDGLLAAFSSCVNCHNCQRVCPICYCRQCYFDSAALELPADNYMERAKRKGALRLAPDTLLFHLGRASHMSVSCVSCGACEDACPVDIPIGQIFSLWADRSQAVFDYVAGTSPADPLPLVAYEADELHQVEQPYCETYNPEVPSV